MEQSKSVESRWLVGLQTTVSSQGMILTAFLMYPNRRVVVACDTCRRKKVKCQGLPNPSSTCNNCAAYNYKCTFSADADRSRGKYEILETKVEALLAALKAVAPHLAEDFTRGKLTVPADFGEDGVPLPSSSRLSHPGSSRGYGNSSRRIATGGAPPGPPTGPSQFEMNTMLPPLSAALTSRILPPLRGVPPDAHGRSMRQTQMVPDLEDGRPRFFGKSSTLSVFHSMDSRPGSPTPDRGHNGGLSSENPSYDDNVASKRRSSLQPHSFERPALPERPSSSKGVPEKVAGPTSGTIENFGGPLSAATGRHASWQTLPQPRPLYPTNSREWVHHLRKKNTVAIGRDDICSEEWATRYMLPPLDLVFHLLDDIYFRHLHPLLPILHPPTFRRDIENGRATHDTAFRGLVFCVLTISSRFSSDRRVLADPNDPASAGDHWAAGSRLYHQAFAASLINVQMLLLTSTFMHASIGPGSAWTILGMAIRASMDIGLHQERAHQDFKPFDQEMRRRAFWAAFILDCIFTICLGRPSAIKMEDCRVNLPLDVSDAALSESEASGEAINVAEKATAEDATPGVAAGFRHMSKLNLLVQDVVSLLYTHGRAKKPGFRGTSQAEDSADTSLGHAAADQEGRPVEDDTDTEAVPPPTTASTDASSSRPAALANLPSAETLTLLCKRLDEWVAGIPEHLLDPSTSPFPLQAGLVSCGRHDIRLYILKPFLADQTIHKQLHAQCVTHARACLKTVVDLYAQGHLKNMFFIFMQAFMSSATFLLTVWHMTKDPKVLAEDATLMEQTARTMATAFDDRYCSSVVQKAWRVLQRVAVRTMPMMSEDLRRRLQRWISTARIGGEYLPVISSGALNNSARASSQIPNARTQPGRREAGLGSSPSQSLASDAPPSSSTYSFATGATAGPYPTSTFGLIGGPSGPINPNAPTSSVRQHGSPPGHWQSASVANRSRSSSRRASPTSFVQDHWTAGGGHPSQTNHPLSPPSMASGVNATAGVTFSSSTPSKTLVSSSLTATPHLTALTPSHNATGTATPSLMPFELSNFGDVHGILGDTFLNGQGQQQQHPHHQGGADANDLLGSLVGGGDDPHAAGAMGMAANGDAYSYLGSEGLWQDWFFKSLEGEGEAGIEG